jgi:hypothetical protein
VAHRHVPAGPLARRRARRDAAPDLEVRGASSPVWTRVDPVQSRPARERLAVASFIHSSTPRSATARRTAESLLGLGDTRGRSPCPQQRLAEPRDVDDVDPPQADAHDMWPLAGTSPITGGSLGGMTDGAGSASHRGASPRRRSPSELAAQKPPRHHGPQIAKLIALRDWMLT